MSDGCQPSHIKLPDATFTNAGEKAMLRFQLEIAVARFRPPIISLFGETLARDDMLHLSGRDLVSIVTARRGASRACKVLLVFRSKYLFIRQDAEPILLDIGSSSVNEKAAAMGPAGSLSVHFGDEAITSTLPSRFTKLVYSVSSASSVADGYDRDLGKGRTRSSDSPDVERDATKLTDALAIPDLNHCSVERKITLEVRIWNSARYCFERTYSFQPYDLRT